MKRDMDFIYTSDHEEILIEHTQQRGPEPVSSASTSAAGGSCI